MSRSIPLLMATFLATSPLLAQPKTTRVDALPSVSKVALLLRRNVQEDLELTDDQMAIVVELATAADAMKKDLEGLINVVWPEERPARRAEVHRKLAKYAKEVNRKLAQLLSEAQIAAKRNLDSGPRN